MKQKKFSSELALLIAVVYNSLNLTLLVKGDFGISTLSSVPLVFSRVFTNLTLGTWTIIIQTITIFIMILIVRKIKLGYLLSFFVAVIFGVFVDMWTVIIAPLPTTLVFRIIYFILGFVGTGVGAAFFILCRLPIQPFDLFVREVTAALNTPLKRTRQVYDLVSITISISVSLIFLGRLEGIGIGTVCGVLFTGIIMHEMSEFLKARYYFKPVSKPGEWLYKIS